MAIDQGIVTIILLLQFAFQTMASYFCFKIYRHNRRYAPWLAVSIGVLLLPIRKVAALTVQFNSFPGYSQTISEFDMLIIPLVASLLFLYAFWSIKKEFDVFHP
ncbi:TPA: hypothetical protein HA244_02250 [Candidatus Micrarchaeota archaeon]|nr:hypothetical protein [Candidatus Micrarchaeota archaeon]